MAIHDAKRFRLIGELQSKGEVDLPAIRMMLADALQEIAESVTELSGVRVRETEDGTVEISMNISAMTWKEASEIGRGTVDKAIERAGIKIDSEERRPDSERSPEPSDEKHFERSGSQLVLA